MFLNTALAEVAQLILQRPPHLCETFGNLFPAILHLQGNLKTRTSPAGAPVSHKQPAAHRAAPSARASPPLPPPPPPSSARSRSGQSPSSCSTSRTGRPPATAQDSLAVDNQPSVGVISREFAMLLVVSHLGAPPSGRVRCETNYTAGGSEALSPNH